MLDTCQLPRLPPSQWLSYLLVRKRIASALQLSRAVISSLSDIAHQLPFLAIQQADDSENGTQSAAWPEVPQSCAAPGGSVHRVKFAHIELRSGFVGRPALPPVMRHVHAFACDAAGIQQAMHTCMALGLVCTSVKDALITSENDLSNLLELQLWARLAFGCVTCLRHDKQLFFACR